jgi:uncharacterized protein DUF4160
MEPGTVTENVGSRLDPWRTAGTAMSPTVFTEDGYRFYFFSREEARPHVHVHHADGEAKVWLDPGIEIAWNQGLAAHRLATVLRLVRDHRDEIRKAWSAHFGR